MGWSQGTYYPDYDWTQDEQNGIPILASRFQDQLEKICLNGISACWKRDGTNNPSANLSMNSHKFTNIIDGTERNEFPSISQIINNQEIVLRSVTSSGDGQYTGDLDIAPTALVDGMMVVFRADKTNEDGVLPTLNVNGLGVRPIYDQMGNALYEGGRFQPFYPYLLVYRGESHAGEWTVIGMYRSLYKGAIIEGNYNDGVNALSTSLSVNNLILYWDTTLLHNDDYFELLPNTGDPNVGIKPLKTGKYSVKNKIVCHGHQFLDGYIACGTHFRAPGNTDFPPLSQIDYRFWDSKSVNPGIGPATESTFIYLVSQNDIDLGKYFVFLGRWSNISGINPYIGNNIMSASYLGEY